MTDGQKKVLTYLEDYLSSHGGYSPSSYEIGKGVGIGRVTAWRYVLWLEKFGYLTIEKINSRKKKISLTSFVNYSPTELEIAKRVRREMKPKKRRMNSTGKSETDVMSTHYLSIPWKV